MKTHSQLCYCKEDKKNISDALFFTFSALPIRYVFNGIVIPVHFEYISIHSAREKKNGEKNRLKESA